MKTNALLLYWFLLMLSFPQNIHAVSPKIATGWNTFALKNDGTLVGMGSDAQGQLGLGRPKFFTSPAQTVGLTQVISVAAGGNHSVALRQDGTVWTWGYNTFGQLGNGTSLNSMHAALVPNLDDVTGISAGYIHTIVVKQDGTVWAWGSNTDGQTSGSYPIATSPIQVSGLSNVIMVAAACDGYHNLALTADGKVWTWGSNSRGQLGDGTSIDRSTPSQVTDLAGVSWIAAGYEHSLAVKSDGTIWAWGANTYGQLGDGTSIDRSTPVQVQGLDAVFGVQTAGGWDYSVLVSADGRVLSWGGELCGTGWRRN